MIKISLSFFLTSLAGHAQGLFGPQLVSSQISLIASHNNLHAYALKQEDGNFAEKYTSPEGKVYAVSVQLNREDAFILFKKPDSDSFAIYRMPGPGVPQLDLNDLKFEEG